MKNLIVANWKENPTTQKEAEELFNAVKRGVEGVGGVEVVICPPFVYLSLLKGLTLGAQNVSYKDKGAYTGEVSPLMLKDLNVKYVILGHSEVRRNFNETNEIVNKKVKEVLAAGLNPILCIGEQEGKNKEEVLQIQLKEGLKGISNFKFQISNLIIAYEPVWAIGTGNNCSVEETKNSVTYIREVIAGLYSKKTADEITILYGGSVNSKNSTEYLKNTGISGLLVGGASLKAEDFVKIVQSAEI